MTSSKIRREKDKLIISLPDPWYKFLKEFDCISKYLAITLGILAFYFMLFSLASLAFGILAFFRFVKIEKLKLEDSLEFEENVEVEEV